MSSWRIGSFTSCRLEHTDISATADYFKLDRAELLSDVQAVVAGFRKNETEMPAVSNTVMDLFDRGWHYATLVLRRDPDPHRPSPGRRAAIARPGAGAARHSKEFAKISVDDPHRRIPQDMGRLRGGASAPDGRLRAASRRARPGAQRRPPAPRARPRSIASPRISPPRRNPAKWTRSSAATRRSGRSSTC